MPNIIYRGSVKDIRGVEGQSPYVFEFSDRYSVFDWGEMPDELDGKGEALAVMAWLFFDLLGDAENSPPQAEVIEAKEKLHMFSFIVTLCFCSALDVIPVYI